MAFIHRFDCILKNHVFTNDVLYLQDVASTVLSYDPLPPLDSIQAYNRPSRYDFFISCTPVHCRGVSGQVVSLNISILARL